MRKLLILAGLALLPALVLTTNSFAYSSYATKTGKSCSFCHINGYDLNSAGEYYKDNGRLPDTTPPPPPPPPPPTNTTRKIQIKPDPQTVAVQGGVIFYQNMWIGNNGTSPETVKLAATSSVPGIKVSFLVDNNGDSKHQDTEITPMDTTPTIQPGKRQWGFAVIEVPASVRETSALITISATSSADAAVTVSTRLTLQITPAPAKNVSFELSKTVVDGETTFTLTARNNEPYNLPDVKVTLKTQSGELVVPLGAIAAGQTASVEIDAVLN